MTDVALFSTSSIVWAGSLSRNGCAHGFSRITETARTSSIRSRSRRPEPARLA
jgi:hypothetical protein